MREHPDLGDAADDQLLLDPNQAAPTVRHPPRSSTPRTPAGAPDRVHRAGCAATCWNPPAASPPPGPAGFPRTAPSSILKAAHSACACGATTDELNRPTAGRCRPPP